MVLISFYGWTIVIICLIKFKDDTPVCCSSKQVFTMEQSIQMAEGIFGRCQTCIKNLLKGICGISCDPDQDKYLTILEMKQGFFGEYVSKIDYRMDEKYPSSVYESCKEVVHPASGKLAMDLACGTEATKCTHEKWYFFMGDPGVNPLVPFKIDYVMSNDSARRFESETKKCSEAYEGSFACSCVDCAATCPSGDPPQPDESGFLLWNLNGTTFTIAAILGTFGVITIMFSSTVGKSLAFPELPMILGGFEEVNVWLSTLFRWWGRSK